MRVPAPRAAASVPPKLLSHARDLRRSATDAESLLWHLLRNRALDDAKFRRQHPEAGYILDFYCAEARLAVELDGGQHAEREAYDANRTAALNARGIRVLRFWNDQVFKETESVLEQILFALQASAASRAPSPLPLSRARERGSPLQAAFVSTNSIIQGEQVGVLWSWMLSQGVKIGFAHRTFQWSNEARGMAAVHCVIVGFGIAERVEKHIYDYEDIRGEPRALTARNINPYLVDAPDVVLARRSRPVCNVPEIGIGNKPIDGGNYLFSPEQMEAFVMNEPASRKWFRRWLGSDEFINGWERWCLWLGNCPSAELRAMPEAMRRVQAVKNFRLASKSAPTRKLAGTPTRFHVENMPASTYLLVPEVSSERRAFIPIGFIPPNTLSSNLVKIVPNATPFHLGILSSSMHMAWVRAVCGRLKSDFRYSAGIVYNNFPWPIDATDSPRAAIESAAQGILDVRAKFPDASLADLYDPLTMPPELVKAHQALDRAVDAAYVPSGGKKTWSSDAERVAFLFGLYQRLTSLLPAAPVKVARKRRV